MITRRATFGVVAGLAALFGFPAWAREPNRCAICREDSPGRNQKWHTDHCHTTGKVRGILCHGCNVNLGHARDSIPILESMIAYLEHHLELHQELCLEKIKRLGGLSARCAEIFNDRI